MSFVRNQLDLCGGMQLQQDRLWTHWVDLAFNKFDANGDGFLSLEEILHHLPPELDGASAKIEFLRSALLHFCPPPPPPPRPPGPSPKDMI